MDFESMDKLMKEFRPWMYPGLRDLMLLYIVVAIIIAAVSIQLRGGIGEGFNLAQDIGHALMHVLLLVYIGVTLLRCYYVLALRIWMILPRSAGKIIEDVIFNVVVSIVSTIGFILVMKYHNIWGVPNPTLSWDYMSYLLVGLGTFFHCTLLMIGRSTLHETFMAIPIERHGETAE